MWFMHNKIRKNKQSGTKLARCVMSYLGGMSQKIREERSPDPKGTGT